MFEIGISHFVLVSILVFAAGVATILSKRNAIGILIGVELVLNAASINLVAFNQLQWGAEHALDGQMFAIFVVVLAAAEAAIALAIFLNFYNKFSCVDVERADKMKG